VTPLGILLVIGGAVALVLGLLRIRGPLAGIRRLDETQANLDRYEVWRGRNTDVVTGGPTGADEMRALLRRQAIGWGAVGAAGAVAILIGLMLR
jgi:hypothetical protein